MWNIKFKTVKSEIYSLICNSYLWFDFEEKKKITKTTKTDDSLIWNWYKFVNLHERNAVRRNWDWRTFARIRTKSEQLIFNHKRLEISKTNYTEKPRLPNTRLCSLAGWRAFRQFCSRIHFVVSRQRMLPQTAKCP